MFVVSTLRSFVLLSLLIFIGSRSVFNHSSLPFLERISPANTTARSASRNQKPLISLTPAIPCLTLFLASPSISNLDSARVTPLPPRLLRAHNWQTLLSWASIFGNLGVVKLLLELEHVGLNFEDHNGRSPLTLAAYSRINKVDELLLAQSEVNADSPGIDGRTPLLWAAGRGHDGVVKPPLARKDIDTNIPERHGAAPLFCDTCRCTDSTQNQSFPRNPRQRKTGKSL